MNIIIIIPITIIIFLLKLTVWDYEIDFEMAAVLQYKLNSQSPVCST